MNQETDSYNAKLNDYFQKKSKKADPEAPLQVLVSSKKLGLDYEYSTSGNNQPFHIASIGKVFTATLVGLLVDRGDLGLDDKIAAYFEAETLRGLFVYKGTDYQDLVTVRELLGHTSGIADYFESSVAAGAKFVDRILGEPDLIWTPGDLLDFTRNNQAALSAPGTFNYSDTGYILLGLLIEKITGESFSDSLSRNIFGPLGMDDSYLMFYSEPKTKPAKRIAKIWFNGVEISGLNMLSCDWAGGGIISTTRDLLAFQEALRGGRLVSGDFLEEMDNCANKYRPGIFYGLGMMELRLEGFFFLLRGLPRPRGHIGILATHMFYDSDNDTHIIMNFGSNKRMVESFKALIAIEQLLKKNSK